MDCTPRLKAHSDSLTGLATPEFLADVQGELTRDLRARGLSLCVLRVGLDGFDTVTTRYGRAAADHALLQVTRRLRQLARADNIVIRCSPDEFSLLLSCAPHEAAASARLYSARVVAELHRPMAYRTVSNLHVGCCVGAALWPADDSNLAEVLLHAEEALATARQSGRGQMRQYTAVSEALAA